MAALSLSDPISFSRSESGVCSEGFQQSAISFSEWMNIANSLESRRELSISLASPALIRSVRNANRSSVIFKKVEIASSFNPVRLQRYIVQRSLDLAIVFPSI